MKKINMAFLAAGNIAEQMAVTIKNSGQVTSYAVAARNIKNAQAFANRHGFQKAYGSYVEMVKDPEVDLVYISSPHSHHYAHAKLCLENGKHVLLEKAFTVNESQAKEIIAIAKEKGLLLTEAIWVRYMPLAKTLQNVIASGIIGEPATLTANLGYIIDHVERLQKPELAGGALLDVGVYPIHFAASIFGGAPQSIVSTAIMTKENVDARNSITLCYEDGKMAVLNSSMTSISDRQGIIYGDKGFIIVQNINNFERIEVYDLNRNILEVYEQPNQITGYEYEVDACVEAIRNGSCECPAIPHEETLRVMRILDIIRAQWNMAFPCE